MPAMDFALLIGMCSGCKAILQRRLHALLVQAAIERYGENMDF